MGSLQDRPGDPERAWPPASRVACGSKLRRQLAVPGRCPTYPILGTTLLEIGWGFPDVMTSINHFSH